MNIHTDEKRYLSDLAVALRLRNISGKGIGEIVAEVEMHTAESGQSAREAFGSPTEYASAFEPAASDHPPRTLGRRTWTGALTAAIGAWLFAAGAFAGMSGTDVVGITGWWASVIGATTLLITFSLLPIDAIIDPRAPDRGRYGRKRLMAWVAVAMAVALLVIIGVMSILG